MILRSTKFILFELLTGVKMKDKSDLKLKEKLNEEYTNCFMIRLEEIKKEARKNIMKVQKENKRQFNRFWKKPKKYEEGDLVAIKRTQFGSGLK